MHNDGQKAGIRKTLGILVGIIVVMLSLIFLNYVTRDVALSAEQAAKLGYIRFEQPRNITIPELVTEQGARVLPLHFQGQWDLLYFGFTACPDICPTTLAVLNQAVLNLEAPPQIHLVTVDPEQDTPAQLARYLASFNSDFSGITGAHEQITQLAIQLNVAFGKVPGAEPGGYTVDHTGSIVVLDQAGRYAGFIKAPHQPAQLQQIIIGL
jgi:protein SCO1/2|tara:strand:- start:18972 stop:19601 length:630 start_codon:yes stop_codon:yes gene_type:complete